MSKIPVTRPVSWRVVPVQLAVLGALVGGTRVAFGVEWSEAFLISAGVYLVYSFGSRALIAREHKAGMRLMTRERFDQAIPHHERSLAFFERRSWVDRWRSLTMLSSGAISYREMAMVNLAFCYAQLGDGDRAEAYYRRALDAFPDSVIATTALRFIESYRGADAPSAGSTDPPRRTPAP
ncbi:MAG: tetratricopeptide repeat protein [Bacteroidota bacterium]